MLGSATLLKGHWLHQDVMPGYEPLIPDDPRPSFQLPAVVLIPRAFAGQSRPQMVFLGRQQSWQDPLPPSTPNTLPTTAP